MLTDNVQFQKFISFFFLNIATISLLPVLTGFLTNKTNLFLIKYTFSFLQRKET